MNTEIILKEYSELSLWQRIKLKYLVPKLYGNFEVMLLRASDEAYKSDSVTSQQIYQCCMQQIAFLMSYYNSDEYSDYRVLELTVDYLLKESTTFFNPVQRGSSQALLEEVFYHFHEYLEIKTEKEA